MGKPIIKLSLDANELAKVLQVEVGKPFPAYFGKFHDYFVGLVVLYPNGEMCAVAYFTSTFTIIKLDCEWALDEDEKKEIITQRMEA